MNEDIELVQRSLKGEKRAFEMIIQKYQSPLANYVRRMVKENELALDITQDVFIKAYSFLHSYRQEYKFKTWIYKIASNTVIDYWRKKKIDAFSIDQQFDLDGDSVSFQIPSKDPSLEKTIELHEVKERIEEVLDKLPLSLKELFIWRHINDLSYEEMAEIKGIPVGTIKNRVFQAKEVLRKYMEKDRWNA
ncbi:RNA polymerase sigma factor [Acidobacteriota bacterium]